MVIRQSTCSNLIRYDITGSNFILKTVIQNLNSKVRFLDFSSDSNYLIVEEDSDNIFVIEVFSKKKIYTENLNFKIDWAFFSSILFLA